MILFGKWTAMGYLRVMLRFRLFGFPVEIDWWFWAVAALLGGATSAHTPEAWMSVGIWVAVVFVSIMVHELGHALAGQKFGASPAIKLHGFGGLTYLPGRHFSRTESIVVSAAGPLAGFALLLVFYAVDLLPGRLAPFAQEAVRTGIYINLVWTLFNLLPIQPMDGGQILRELLGPRRAPVTAVIGGTLAVVLAVWAFRAGLIFTAVMLAVFAYYNFSRAPVEGGVIKG